MICTYNAENKLNKGLEITTEFGNLILEKVLELKTAEESSPKGRWVQSKFLGLKVS